MFRLTQASPLQKPFYVLLAFALLFFPPLHRALSPQGLWTILYSPQLLFVLGSLWIYQSSGLSHKDIGLCLGSKKFYLQAVALCILVFALMYSAHLLLAQQAAAETLQAYTPTLIQLVMLLVLAPLAEEVFFRGIVFHALCKQYNLLTAMLVSSLLFMATHNSLLLATFTLGLLSSYWTHKSKSIYPGMLFHCISNTFVLFAHNFAPNLGKLADIIFF